MSFVLFLSVLLCLSINIHTRMWCVCVWVHVYSVPEAMVALHTVEFLEMISIPFSFLYFSI